MQLSFGSDPFNYIIIEELTSINKEPMAWVSSPVSGKLAQVITEELISINKEPSCTGIVCYTTVA